MDPSIEPERRGPAEAAAPPDAENCKTFAVLQQYNRLHVLVAVGTKHMWHAEMESKSCELTWLGADYRRRVAPRRI